jgi:hypothetical protein
MEFFDVLFNPTPRNTQVLSGIFLGGCGHGRGDEAQITTTNEGMTMPELMRKYSDEYHIKDQIEWLNHQFSDTDTHQMVGNIYHKISHTILLVFVGHTIPSILLNTSQKPWWM